MAGEVVSFAVMKEVKVELSVSDLLAEVRRRAEYIGKSLQEAGKDATAYDRVRATEADDEQLVASVKNALSALKTHLQEWVKDTTSVVSEADTGATLTLTLGMPSNWDAHLSDAVAQEAREYAVLTALGDWLGITDKDDAGGVTQGAADHLALLNEAINKRIRPTLAYIKSITEEEEESEESTVTSEEFEALEARVSTAEKDIDTLEASVEALQASDVSALSTRTGTLETNVSTLQSKMETAESDIEGLFKNQNEMVEELSDATTHVEECVERLDGHDKAINANKSSIEELTSDVGTLQEERVTAIAYDTTARTLTLTLGDAETTSVAPLQVELPLASETQSGLMSKTHVSELAEHAERLNTLESTQTADKAELEQLVATTETKLTQSISDTKTELEQSISDTKDNLQGQITEVSEDLGTKYGAVDELTRRVDNLEATAGGETKETVTTITGDDVTMWPVSNDTTLYTKDLANNVKILLPFDAEFLGRRLRICVEGTRTVTVAPGRAYRYHLYYDGNTETLIYNTNDEEAGAIKSAAAGTSATMIGCCKATDSSGTTTSDVYGLQLTTGSVELVAVPSGATRYAVPTGTSVVQQNGTEKDKYSLVVYTNDYKNTLDDRTGVTTGCVTKTSAGDDDAVTDVSTLGLESVELVRWVLVAARGDVKGMTNAGLTASGTLS